MPNNPESTDRLQGILDRPGVTRRNAIGTIAATAAAAIGIRQMAKEPSNTAQANQVSDSSQHETYTPPELGDSPHIAFFSRDEETKELILTNVAEYVDVVEFTTAPIDTGAGFSKPRIRDFISIDQFKDQLDDPNSPFEIIEDLENDFDKDKVCLVRVAIPADNGYRGDGVPMRTYDEDDSSQNQDLWLALALKDKRDPYSPTWCDKKGNQVSGKIKVTSPIFINGTRDLETQNSSQS